MDSLERELTTLEYIVLGLIAVAPQTGYSIIGALEGGANRFSTSPGSIYPILKRLEKQVLIVGVIEAVYETRPRKVYALTATGEVLLDEWLRRPLDNREILERRDIALLKFLFSEKRLSRAEVLAWLEHYAERTRTFDVAARNFVEMGLPADSVHSQLVLLATERELTMQLAWITEAQTRLSQS